MGGWHEVVGTRQQQQGNVHKRSCSGATAGSSRVRAAISSGCPPPPLAAAAHAWHGCSPHGRASSAHACYITAGRQKAANTQRAAGRATAKQRQGLQQQRQGRSTLLLTTARNDSCLPPLTTLVTRRICTTRSWNWFSSYRQQCGGRAGMSGGAGGAGSSARPASRPPPHCHKRRIGGPDERTSSNSASSSAAKVARATTAARWARTAARCCTSCWPRTAAVKHRRGARMLLEAAARWLLAAVAAHWLWHTASDILPPAAATQAMPGVHSSDWWGDGSHACWAEPQPAPCCAGRPSCRRAQCSVAYGTAAGHSCSTAGTFGYLHGRCRYHRPCSGARLTAGARQRLLAWCSSR